jgi:hypothetical protein
VDPVPDPLLLRKSGSAGNRARDLRDSSQKLRLLDHRGGHGVENHPKLGAVATTQFCQNALADTARNRAWV